MHKNVKIRAIVSVILVILSIPLTLFARNNHAGNHRHHRYRLIDIGTFGGPQSHLHIFDVYARILNEGGMVAGFADTPIPDPHTGFCFTEDCFVTHAFQWQDGEMTDLGVLGDDESSSSRWISPNGLIAGASQNGEIDPLIPGFPETRALLWKHGEITDLGTLEGGYESVASAVNSSGQIVGYALNGIADPFSILGLGYQVRAFLWQAGSMQDLGTLG